MAKRIVLTILGGLAVLIVLALGMILLLVPQSQSFFGPAISWLLIACVGIMMLFDLYMVISYIIEIVRRHRLDEERLSERSIEKILSGEASRKKRSAPAPKVNVRQEEADARKQIKKDTEQAKASRKQEEHEAKIAAEQQAEIKRKEAIQAKSLAEAEAKASRIAKAESAARERAAKLENDEEKSVALAEADALQRASEEAHKRAAEEEAVGLRMKRETEEQQKAEQQKAEQRKLQAIESVRKQAEATAAARRRAAQTAAQTQSFAPIGITDSLPTFNSQVLPLQVQDTPIVHSSYEPDASLSAPLPHRNENIWEKMHVKQSAAPLLPGNDAKNTADEEDTSPPKVNTWTYAPAKLPGAWQTDDSRRKMPGDMSYADSLVTAASHAAVQKAKDEKAAHEMETAASAVPTVKRPIKRAPSAPKPAARPAETKAPAAGGKPKASGKPVAASAPVPSAKPAAKAKQSARPLPAKPGVAPLAKSKIPGVAPKPSAASNVRAATKPTSLKPTLPTPTSASKSPDVKEIKRPRGRPPKILTEEELNAPKRPRGRPPKILTEEELNAPKRPRGRPPKILTEEELNAPKRPRGRPRKNPDSE